MCNARGHHLGRDRSSLKDQETNTWRRLKSPKRRKLGWITVRTTPRPNSLLGGLRWQDKWHSPAPNEQRIFCQEEREVLRWMSAKPNHTRPSSPAVRLLKGLFLLQKLRFHQHEGRTWKRVCFEQKFRYRNSKTTHFISAWLTYRKCIQTRMFCS